MEAVLIQEHLRQQQRIEMAMAPALGLATLNLRSHSRDAAGMAAIGVPSSAVVCHSLARAEIVRYGGALQCMVQSWPRRRPVVVVQGRQGSEGSQMRSQSHAGIGEAVRKPIEDSRDFQTTSVPANSTLPPSPTYIGSPLLWIGVGVGVSVLFSWAANYAKKQVMQQALKSMMGTAGPNPFGSMQMPSGGSPFPFPIPPQPSPSPISATSPASVLETPEVTKAAYEVAAPVTENNKPAFTDVNVTAETTTVKIIPEDQQEQEEKQPNVFFKDPEIGDAGTPFGWNTDGAATASSSSASSDGKSGSYFSVETLEKMLEDPTVQQMVYPYLPQEMRNPGTFKWMMQNPQFRNQLQEMLSNMTEDGAWKSGQMADVLKNFNPNNQELKQQFEQIGLTPEEVMAKMVANPEIAMAFQNPKIQAALIDCSQNPTNITKYQNDKEIMDVFNKIAELFPIKGF